jgi:predicted membrane-bound mannosyltransferase
MVEIRRDTDSVNAVIPVGIPEAIGAISIVVPVKTTEAAAAKVQASEAEASEMAAAEVEATEVTTSKVTATKVTTTEMPAAEVTPTAKTAGACGLRLGDDGCNQHCEHDTQ